MKTMYAITPHLGNKTPQDDFMCKAVFDTEEDAKTYIKYHFHKGRKFRIYRVDSYTQEDFKRMEFWRKEQRVRDKEKEKQERLEQIESSYRSYGHD